jgi:protein-S-isoprenylcysteine O-methyltransferase Ste14
VHNTTFKIIFLVGFAVSSLIRAPYTKRNRLNRIVDDRMTGQDKLLLLCTSIGMIIVPFLYVLTPWLDFADYHLPTWAGWLGVMVLVVSTWLFWRSHADLGKNWFVSVQFREGHTLVTRGVFRHMRHPMYASQWLWGIAQTLLLQNWIAGLIGLVGFIPMYLLRVPSEERMMLEHFGEAYRSYMKRTGRVFPRLWGLRGGKSAVDL